MRKAYIIGERISDKSDEIFYGRDHPKSDLIGLDFFARISIFTLTSLLKNCSSSPSKMIFFKSLAC